MVLIAAFDGGGFRALYTAETTRLLEEASPFLSSVELFAGTSSGSFLALALAQGITPEQVVCFFEQEASEIFKSRGWWDELTGLDEWVRSDFDADCLHQVLEELLGPGTLGDLPKRVLIPTFSLKRPATGRWGPEYLHNYDSPGNDKSVSIADAAKRSSAAPTYFRAHQGCVDGGLVANNPATAALAKVCKNYGSQVMADTWLLSIGTGVSPRSISGQNNDWGVSQWMEKTRLLDMLFDGQVADPDYECAQFLGRYHPQTNPEGRYLRINVQLDAPMRLSAVTKAPELLAFARSQDLTHAEQFVAKAQEASQHLPPGSCT